MVLNVRYRHRLAALSDDISGTVTILGSFLADNGTAESSHSTPGTYEFTDTAIGIRKYVVNGK
jgi:hypothetical protein